MILKLLYVYIFCLYVTKRKQISKITVATYYQGLYGVIDYTNSEYDIKIIVKWIFVVFCLHVTKVNKFQKLS